VLQAAENHPPELIANSGGPAMATSALLTPLGYAQFVTGCSLPAPIDRAAVTESVQDSFLGASGHYGRICGFMKGFSKSFSLLTVWDENLLQSLNNDHSIDPADPKASRPP
jgi:hypothetical protein